MGSNRSFKTGKIFLVILWWISLLWISFATFLSTEMFEILPQYFASNGSGTIESNSGMVMSWDEYSWCYASYCRSSRDEFFIKVEEKFVEDMKNNLHSKDETEWNKCKWFHISSIAYGFSSVEHGNGDSNIANITNNITSLKESLGWYQYMRKKEYGKYKWYVKYPNKFEALLDFMYLYKYGYGCFVGPKWVANYKEGKGTDTSTPNFKRYYSNLVWYIDDFESRNYQAN